ncbi:MAG TPA: hypothetical protein VN328_13755 [Thermodesulfovibrionales bacterium]|nr:hypothetical protein [Thermodesulfovibrionales bacterium]
MIRYLFLFFLANLLLIQCAFGFDVAGIRPLAPFGVFSTFGAESLGKGRSGIAIGIEKSKDPDYYRFMNQFAYGITDNIEVDITVPYVVDWQSTTDGFEDIAFGVKHRFFDEGKYGPSIAYIISVSVHSGRPEFSTQGSIGGGLILSKRVGPITGHVNVLYFRPGTSKFTDDITFAAGLDFAASHNFKILGEVYGKKSYAGKVDRLELRLGYRILTTEHLFTTIGAGYDVKSRAPEYRLMLSVSYLLSGETKKIKKIFEQEE